MKILADVTEFSKGVYELIISGDYKKFINQTRLTENPLFTEGFIQGLTWATILLNGNYGNYCVKEGDITDAPDNDRHNQ